MRKILYATLILVLAVSFADKANAQCCCCWDNIRISFGLRIDIWDCDDCFDCCCCEEIIYLPYDYWPPCCRRIVRIYFSPCGWYRYVYYCYPCIGCERVYIGHRYYWRRAVRLPHRYTYTDMARELVRRRGLGEVTTYRTTSHHETVTRSRTTTTTYRTTRVRANSSGTTVLRRETVTTKTYRTPHKRTKVRKYHGAKPKIRRSKPTSRRRI